MNRWIERAGIAVLSLIPLFAFLAAFEIYTFPMAHRWDDYVIGGYAGLCFVILTYQILAALWRRWARTRSR